MAAAYPPVSVVIPVKNEERNIASCLCALRGFPEVFVVDSASTDRTREIVRSFGVPLVEFTWNGRPPKKRNWCLRRLKFSQPWVLFLDADECVTEEFRRELIGTLPSTSHNGFWIRYQNVFLGRVLRHGDPMRKLALIRLGHGEYETVPEERWSNLDMEVHEHPIVHGTLGCIRAPIIHNDFKGLTAYLHRHNEYSSWEAKRYKRLVAAENPTLAGLTSRQRIKYALLGSWFLGPLYFVFSYILRLGFLDGMPGFVFALLKMFYFMQIRAKICEKDAEPYAAGPACASGDHPVQAADDASESGGAPPRIAA